jgi:ComF family protein
LSIFKDFYFNICTKFKQILPAQPCQLCGSMTPHSILCEPCDASLPYLNAAHCPVCALPTLNSAICGQCLQHPPHYKRTIAVFAYAFPLNKLILALKYGDKLHLAGFLAEQLSHRINALPDCIVAMPLHPARLKERGFNQSMQLSKHIGKYLNIPVLMHACVRLRNTPSQSTLPLNERSRNVRKAFSCVQDVAGKHVAIVDDVMTTGATLNELALVLLNAGATEVSAWVVARTLPHSGHQS